MFSFCINGLREVLIQMYAYFGVCIVELCQTTLKSVTGGQNIRNTRPLLDSYLKWSISTLCCCLYLSTGLEYDL